MTESSALSVQGRWAWWALPLVALGSLVFLWDSLEVIRQNEWEARTALRERAGEWKLIHAFTGRTVGR